MCVCVYTTEETSFKKVRDKPAAWFLYKAKKATETEKKIMNGLRLTVSLLKGHGCGEEQNDVNRLMNCICWQVVCNSELMKCLIQL